LNLTLNQGVTGGTDFRLGDLDTSTEVFGFKDGIVPLVKHVPTALHIGLSGVSHIDNGKQDLTFLKKYASLV
jgi:hypothetical protein